MDLLTKGMDPQALKLLKSVKIDPTFDEVISSAIDNFDIVHTIFIHNGHLSYRIFDDIFFYSRREWEGYGWGFNPTTLELYDCIMKPYRDEDIERADYTYVIIDDKHIDGKKRERFQKSVNKINQRLNYFAYKNGT